VVAADGSQDQSDVRIAKHIVQVARTIFCSAGDEASLQERVACELRAKAEPLKLGDTLLDPMREGARAAPGGAHDADSITPSQARCLHAWTVASVDVGSCRISRTARQRLTQGEVVVGRVAIRFVERLRPKGRG